MSRDSIAGNLTNIRAIINFVSKEHGLQPSSTFSVVYLGEPTVKKKRYVPTNSEMKKLQALCYSTDDEFRWLVALVSDTGIRLVEANGLLRADLDLRCSIPQ